MSASDFTNKKDDTDKYHRTSNKRPEPQPKNKE